MLKKIINELKNTENEAEQIIEDAGKEAQKMHKNEKEHQEKLKNKTIDDWKQKGQDMVEARVKKAKQQAQEIRENSKKEKESIRKNFTKKYDQAVRIILDQLGKENGDISGQ